MILVPRKAIVSLSLLFFSFSALAQQEKSLDQFKWLEGHWLNADSTVIEQWQLDENKFTGVVQSVEKKTVKPKILEQLELKVKKGQLVYVAITKEHNMVPMDFKIESWDSNGFSAYHPTNDFPKWIIYKQTKPGVLLVIIKNEEMSKEFHFNKISPPGENDK